MLAISYYIILVVVCFCSHIADAFESDYFSRPYLCSHQELSERLNKKVLDMTWNFKGLSHFRFISSNQEIYFEICLDQTIKGYDDFFNRVGDKLVQLESGQLVFSYKISEDGLHEMTQFLAPRREKSLDKSSYLIANRRILESAHPESITQNALEAILKTKRVLFYTGAGVSLASKIPAMNELTDLFELEIGERFIYSLEKAILFPREFSEKVKIFHKACLYSDPTPAHFALKELTLYNNTRLITENLDCLHEASGIYPYRVNPKHLREEVGGLDEIDCIICVGLSYDDRGFLGWFKEQNPEGKIIAIDVCQPSYLGDEDFWIQEDLQTLLPNLQKTISSPAHM